MSSRAQELWFYLPSGVSIETAREKYAAILLKKHGGRIPKNLDPANLSLSPYYENQEKDLAHLILRIERQGKIIVWSAAEIREPELVMRALKDREAEAVTLLTLDPFFIHDPRADEGLFILKAMAMGREKEKEKGYFGPKISLKTRDEVRQAKKQGEPRDITIGRFKISRASYYEITKGLPRLERRTRSGEEIEAVLTLEEKTKGLHLEQDSARFVQVYLQRYSGKSTIESYLKDLKTFTEYMRQRGPFTSLFTVSEDEAIAYFNDLKARGLSASTIARKISTMRGLYKTMQRKKGIDENPFEDTPRLRLDQNKLKTKPVSLEAVKAMIDKARERAEAEEATYEKARRAKEHLLLHLLATTGARIGAILNVRLSDIERRGNYHHIKLTSKVKDEPYEIPLDGSTHRLIEKYEAEYHKGNPESSYLLPESYTRPHRSLSQRSVTRLIKYLSRKLQLPTDISAHSFRVFAAIEWHNEGMSMREIQRRLDHASINQTAKYIAISQKLPPETFFEKLGERAS
jgi:integrase/recombinase XerD